MYGEVRNASQENVFQSGGGKHEALYGDILVKNLPSMIELRIKHIWIFQYDSFPKYYKGVAT